MSDRHEVVQVGVRFSDRLRRIVGLLNDKDRRIWSNPVHLQ